MARILQLNGSYLFEQLSMCAGTHEYNQTRLHVVIKLAHDGFPVAQKNPTGGFHDVGHLGVFPTLGSESDHWVFTLLNALL